MVCLLPKFFPGHFFFLGLRAFFLLTLLTIVWLLDLPLQKLAELSIPNKLL